ncbi:MAG: HlyC/CorC family transporter [Acidimicrobiales bacterium]|nr:HlyC/CorC family transporter [Acidimicrobiales bacterium]
MNIYIGLLVSVLLVGANAFFVAVEFALVASDRNKLEALAAEGKRPAKAAVAALKGLSFHLSGAQLGITISSLVLGFVTKSLVGGSGTFLALAVATVFQMVLGELIPKNLAVARPERSAMLLSRPAIIVHGLLGPFIRVFNGAANATVRWMGIEPTEEVEAIASIEELEYLIRVSGADGALEPETHALLARTIRFADKTAADALRPRGQIAALGLDATIEDLVDIVTRTGHSRYPVYGNGIDDIRGIVNVTAAFDLPVAARGTTLVSDVMIEPVVVPETRELLDAIADMTEHQTQLVVVIDEHGGTEGILTLEDALEEIAGEIDDEYDAAEVLKVDQAEGVYLISGTLGWSELEEVCGLELADGDYETVAGFFLARFGGIPVEGDFITYRGWRLEVAEMDRRRVAALVVTDPTQGGQR